MILLCLLLIFPQFSNSQTHLSESDRARSAFLHSFWQFHKESKGSPCSLIPEEKLGFCREGIHAGKIRTQTPADLIFKPVLFNSDLQLDREAALGFGIGVSQFPEIYKGQFHQEVDSASFAAGLKYYLVDGIGMGLYAPNKLHIKTAIESCRAFSYSIDRTLCFFGLGRASLFARNEIYRQAELGLNSIESYHLRQGFLFAKMYANRDFADAEKLSEPGSLAGLAISPARKTNSSQLFKKEKECVSKITQHHYLCALTLIRPELLNLY